MTTSITVWQPVRHQPSMRWTAGAIEYAHPHPISIRSTQGRAIKRPLTNGNQCSTLACLQQVLLICSFLQGESDFGLPRRNAINETGPKSCSRLGQCKGAKNWYRSLGNEEETAYYSTNIGTPAHPVLCTNRGRDRFLLHLILIFNDFWFNPSQTMEAIFRVNL